MPPLRFTSPSHSFLVSILAAPLFFGTVHAELVAYWSFDDYTETDDNPAGTPQGNHEGWFEDLSGNGHRAYAADLTNANYVPVAPGRTGNAFYSKSPASDANNGAMAVVQHTDLINFAGEDFTISFWEKVAFRDVAGNGWAPGRGRTQWFMKAPYMPPGAEGEEGFGLNLTQNHFDFLSNNTDNFGQTSLGARFTYESGSEADDSGTWAHWAITGSYDQGSDLYTIMVYLNGEAVDWNGATGTSFTVPGDTIDNEGDLTLGGFFRNNSWAHQRFISWNMSSSGQAADAEGWMDDFAMWSVLLTEDQVAALADGSASPLTVLGNPPPFEFNEVSYDPDGGELLLRWDSQDSKLYNLRSETDPSSKSPAEWSLFEDHQDLAATPPENTLIIPLPEDPFRLFAIEEFDAPPMIVFSDNFESGPGEWTTGSDGEDGTDWELGSPSGVGPSAAHSPDNCFATNVASDYALNAEAWLRSPPIDLTNAGEATLNYFQFLDIEEGFDAGRVTVLDATNNSELAVIDDLVDGIAPDWEEVTTSLPPAALGRVIKLEFRFASDEIGNFAGWYLDNLIVTVP